MDLTRRVFFLVYNASYLCTYLCIFKLMNQNFTSISECSRIYSELDKLISAKRFLTETEINTVKTLCTGFGNFTKYFPNENFSRKIHELIFDVPCFWRSAKHWMN